MATTITTYGDSLAKLAERLPQIDGSELWVDDRHPAEEAVEALFLRRIRAVIDAADPTLPVDEARRVVRETAPLDHLRIGSAESNERRILHIAVRRGLLMCSETVDDQPDLWSTPPRCSRDVRSRAGRPSAGGRDRTVDR